MICNGDRIYSADMCVELKCAVGIFKPTRTDLAGRFLEDNWEGFWFLTS